MKVTRLDLGGIIAPFSDRDISETIQPIGEASNLRRTINGRLISVSNPNYKKYRVSVTGKDIHVPAFDGIWPGEALEVVPAASMSYHAKRPSGGFLTAPGVHPDAVEVIVNRQIGAPEIEAYDAGGQPLEIFQYMNNRIWVENCVSDIYINYRPLLSVVVENWTFDENERTANMNWSLQLIEN